MTFVRGHDHKNFHLYPSPTFKVLTTPLAARTLAPCITWKQILGTYISRKVLSPQVQSFLLKALKNSKHIQVCRNLKLQLLSWLL